MACVFFGALLLCPCLFRPSDNVWCSRRADAPRCAHFSTVISSSGTSDPNVRPTLSTLTRDTGSKDPMEQSRSDRELRKARLQPDMSYDFRSLQGDFVASSPAYPGLARGASGGASTNPRVRS